MELATLRTPRLVLSPVEASDVDTIAELCQDPEIQKWTTVPSPYTRESAEFFVESVAKPGWQGHSPNWAIRLAEGCHLTDDASAAEHQPAAERQPEVERSPLIGIIGISSDSVVGEVGFWMSPQERGSGYAAEALKAVCDFAFEAMGLQALTWRCEIRDGEPNWPSMRVAWKAGFTLEGVSRGMLSKKGKAFDAVIGSLLPSDSREPKGPWTGPAKRRPGFGDPNRPEDLVRQFHDVYSLPVVEDGPDADRERVHMRLALVAEEFAELVGAVYGRAARERIDAAFEEARKLDDGTRDTVETADALGDIVYVVYGMALELGIPLSSVLAECPSSARTASRFCARTARCSRGPTTVRRTSARPWAWLRGTSRIARHG